MKLPRRKFLQLAAGAAALSDVPRAAAALDYPTRPVEIIVDLPAGLAPDVAARLIAPPLSARLGQSVVVENRPGAGGNIGAEDVVRAEPDGYTLLLEISGNAVNATLYPHLSFDFLRDIAPVAFIGATPFVLAVNPSFPAKSVPEFIAYAKANPGKINVATAGVGTAPHLACELFKMMTGLNLVQVPYRSNYMPDVLGGQVPVAFVAVAAAVGYLKSGKLRGLGVTSAAPMSALPDIPPIGQFVPGYEGSGWLGVGAPKNTPAEIIDKLNKQINAVIADPAMKPRLLALGVEPDLMTPAQFGKHCADATEKWAKVIKFANIKAE
ncbi:MAG TPA: tripartite tricarboxylate transporter substrate binding protein [Xanthobacteraceae bacterium]|nr:tripartite tricarboxylate transporter substrate binding protein [Xanthobacteraceae bacterium]